MDICTYLQLLGQVPISCTAFRLCPSQAQSLIWGGNEQKASSDATSTAPTIPEEPSELSKVLFSDL